jgi:ABC-2 type transport system permease protein
MTFLAHSWFLALRVLRNLFRQPMWVVISVIQPILWLLLYGQLFKKVVELPGFNADSYISFVTPGLIIMSALQSGGWNGMGMIADMNSGVMDRFLVSPINRWVIIMGRILSMYIMGVTQWLVLIALGYATGARFAGGIIGVTVLYICGIMLAAPFAMLSHTLALVIRKQESILGVANLILMPLMFLSPILIDKNVMPDWIRSVSRFNPVNWSIDAAREALGADTDWNFVLLRIGWLLALTIISAAVATRAFRAYQRSA